MLDRIVVWGPVGVVGLTCGVGFSGVGLIIVKSVLPNAPQL